jgi:peptidoglycan hydrolase-like protein with peptidoglycan-binding domain
VAEFRRAGVQKTRGRRSATRPAAGVGQAVDQPAPARGDISALQRTVGNHAVLTLLVAEPSGQGRGADVRQRSPRQAQRLTAEEKAENLTSPRFAGEPRLERAFDNSPPMGAGESGDPVARVQEALVAAGFAMPLSTKPTGEMDGIFGSETLRVVRAFQSQRALTPDGRVGRQTLGALDRQEGLRPVQPDDVAPREPGLEDGDGGQDDACAVLQEIETTVDAQPASSFVQRDFTQSTQAFVPGVAANAGRDPLGNAVRRFKAAVNASGLSDDENVARTGQFFWGRRVRLATAPKIEALLTIDRRTLPFVVDARAVVDLIRQRDATVPQRLNALERTARTLSVSPAARQAMLDLMAAPRKSAPGLETFLWNALNSSAAGALPTIPAEHLSLRTAHMLSLWDAQSCGFHAAKVAERLSKRGATPARNTVNFSIDLVPGPPWADQDRQVRAGRLLGEVVRQRGVAAAIPKMKAALDAAQVLHARVLSGIGYGKKLTAPPGMTVRNGQVLAPEPPEEHSLIVIGHNGIDTFVFNDPDATVSHSPEPGFGLLFFDPSRGTLTTAASPAGMLVDTGGKDALGNKRYQVLTISTF